MGKKKRRGRGKDLLGSHQKCWLWGRHAVMETLRAGRWIPVEIVWDAETLTADLQSELESLADEFDVPLIASTGSELQRICGAGDHQGLVAKMPTFPYADHQQVISSLRRDSDVLILCGLQDPFNFGSILRSADLFGVDAVFVPTTGQAAVSSHVARSSVGAVNYLDIVQSDDLTESCRQLRTRGLRLLGATEHGNALPAAVDLTAGIALLVGNEGTGIPTELLELCDDQLCIPMTGHVGSLNAAVAAGILCYEVQRQRMTAGAKKSL
ncbi:TrmH family RNA methyltransferase [Planctomicrobium piriforme]|uniref:TrmH family RNA methyltransferase n=1 Tax=Planctomicrobium piriforme TaxID=1576369 RepID=UPI001113B1B2|nr:RNA methyltransferase [Planctomicrobium piriforme]